MNSKIIIALDFNNRDQVFKFLEQFGDEKLFLKVGMELFYAEGNGIVEELKGLGHNVFLDLKLYDIPTTVAKSIESLGKLGVDMLTVHTSGGEAMLKAANDMASKYNINLLGVTILTSLDVDELLKTDYQLEEIIDDLANKAQANNLYGIVCSAKDISALSVDQVKFVTPGIRQADDSADDQKRVMTPSGAIANGSDFLVIGRSITKASDPLAVYKKIKQEIGE